MWSDFYGDIVKGGIEALGELILPGMAIFGGVDAIMGVVEGIHTKVEMKD